MTIKSDLVSERVDEIVENIRDLKTNVEELQSDGPTDIDPESLDLLKSALDGAVEASDRVENDLEEVEPPPQPKG